MSEIKDLEPQIIWKNFHALTQVPRPSGHLEKVQQFLLKWAETHGIEAFKDGGENIVMRKPATPGMENRKKVVMQAHMDMVPQKTADSTHHNFETDPIETYIDGDWVKAKGTTLGSDDGMGVAAILAVLEDESLEHGPIEALITADEETCMYGVNHLAPDTLTGDILLNLDNETLGELVVGSAGGVDVTASIVYKPVETDPADVAVRVSVKGLRGGHSGLEIGENRANANKLMARFLQLAIRENEARLVSWTGGNMRNAIPRESVAVVTLPVDDVDGLQVLVDYCNETFTEEYRGVEKDIVVSMERVDTPAQQIPEEIQDNVLDAVMACHNGVLRYIPSMPHIVETSSNLAIINIDAERAEVLMLARGSSESMLDYETAMLESCFNMAGMKVEFSGRYGAWQPNFDSEITAELVKVYKKLFNEDALVQVVHAGLECSLIGEVYPQMDMVSFGPTLRSPHTPDERCNVPSVAKFWTFLKEVLRQIPVKS
ncbi:MAG: aminoacyl-histidine dipeptidase [Paraprevotella sp.]|nr:aminoacyl-histidine dipeptidase [Paraprevotella sp.]